jgi:CubicO group peptidase (beta-lactamase class C family)
MMSLPDDDDIDDDDFEDLGTDPERLGPVALLDHYVHAGPCTDCQLVAWVADEQVVSYAVGEARPGVPMSTDTKARLDCAVKPVIALGVLWLRDRGLLSIDVPVSRYIPEFACGGKEAITPHHLLTHTSGLFTSPDIGPYRTSSAILEHRLFRGSIGDWRPGAMATYDVWGGWYTLAAIIERVTTTPWAQFLTEHVLEPMDAGALELVASGRLGHDGLELPYRSLRSRSLRARSRRGRSPDERSWGDHATFPLRHLDQPVALAYPNPAYGGYSSMEILTVIYRTLADRTRCADLLGIDPTPMRTPQRPVLYDHTLGVHCSMAYGMKVRLDSWNYCRQIAASAFGHWSNMGTWGFCDPEANLVVGLRMNGAPSALTNDCSTYRSRNGHPVVRAIYRMIGRRP